MLASQYYNVNTSKPVLPPPPPHNNGWFTGEPFAKDAAYGPVPIIPDTGFLVHFNLRSALPPPRALTQYPGNHRPGNNYQPMPGIQAAPGPYNLWCANEAKCNPPSNTRFSKYAYLDDAARPCV